MVRNKEACLICGQFISLSNMSKHLARHERGKSLPAAVPTEYSVDHDDLFCKFCGRECKNKNSLRNHERLCKLNPNRMTPTGVGNPDYALTHTAWNKGLTKETDTRVEKNSIAIRNHFIEHGAAWSGRKHSTETKRKIALSMAGNTSGNRSKKGYYSGIYCGSSYELAYVIYNLDHNIPFTRCERYYEYINNGEAHLYFPDFELPDGTIIEIKGYHTELVDIKAEAVKDRPIKVLYKKDLLSHISYVCQKYGVTEHTLFHLFDR